MLTAVVGEQKQSSVLLIPELRQRGRAPQLIRSSQDTLQFDLLLSPTGGNWEKRPSWAKNNVSHEQNRR